MNPVSVTVVGLGYIGLPTAALIADGGDQVTGVDIAPHVVETINRGEIHIEESNLDELVHRVVQAGQLRASTEMAEADVFLIAVPTPITDANLPNVDYVMTAARDIAPFLRKGNLVIIESTCPVGTTEEVARVFAEARPDLAIPHGENAGDIALAYCPERVLPGRILVELKANDRSIGGMSPACAAAAAEFYSRFVEGKRIETSARAAEMTKLVENSFRDVNIAFANELSMICETLGIDVWEVIKLANHHPRVNILQPGPGVGGHCIAVDPWFIVSSDPDNSRLIRTAREVNLRKTEHVLTSILELMARSPDARVAFLGLAFKPNIDDLRESPALQIVESVAQGHADRMMVVEPHVDALPATLQAKGIAPSSLGEALVGAQIVVLLVDHDQFKAVDQSLLAGKTIYDCRGVWR
jgi:UDP-N-acetyl-D-mannosaminuronic acid dehydrogenase